MNLSGESGIPVVVPSSSNNNMSGALDHITSHSHQHLILAAQSGCRTAFDELWDLYSRRVYRTALSITKNEQDAEDALQDAFLRAFQAIESFEGRASFYTWLTRIAINSSLGILRKRRCRPESSLYSISQQEEDGIPDELRDLAPNPEQIFEQQQRHAKLIQAIHKLPEILREALQTRIAGDCSAKEVAHQLNISEAAAKSRLARASTRLGMLITTGYGSKVKASIQYSTPSIR
ncbi:RNA polymerase sigma-70 factor (ECF subfamily) [Edaphobacter lichenicola]|uniref:RNA polymerase sigma-70 factor (ECF subfamily) n=2 Tax=Tunturiibacter gelidiferens TaxID=3069689 RepID=A0A9X0QK26_9BACT|nr:RNA polymerase sigma-70 factor (ECF subfamily) [Edaphobacter lichenicola]